MRGEDRRVATLRARAALGLLVASTACQLALDTDYTFTDRDAGIGIGTLDPSPSFDPDVDAGSPLGPVNDGGGADARPPMDDLEPGPPVDDDPGGAEPEPPAPAPDPELPPDPNSGCSVVVYCRAYERLDTTAEELCRQLGCSLDEAIAECRAEMPFASVCGPNSAPPYTIIALSGDELILN
jgi:hypothetical protein